MKGKLFIAFVLGMSVGFLSCGNEPKQEVDQTPEAYRNPVVSPITHLIQLAPEEPKNYFDRAQALAQLQADSLAIIDFKKAISLDANNLGYKLAYADFLFEIKNFSEAQYIYRQILDANPNDFTVGLSLLQSHLHLSDVHAAQETLHFLEEKSPGNPILTYFQAEVKLLEKDTTQAIKILDKVLSEHPNLYAAVFLKGEVMAAQNNGTAVQYFEKAFQLDTLDVLPLELIGDFFRENNQPERALEYYRKTVTHNSTYAYGFYKTALVYRQLDSADKALSNLDLALQHNVRYVAAYLEKASILLQAGRKDEAKSMYETALQFEPRNAEALAGLKSLQSS